MRNSETSSPGWKYPDIQNIFKREDSVISDDQELALFKSLRSDWFCLNEILKLSYYYYDQWKRFSWITIQI